MKRGRRMPPPLLPSIAAADSAPACEEEVVSSKLAACLLPDAGCVSPMILGGVACGCNGGRCFVGVGVAVVLVVDDDGGWACA